MSDYFETKKDHGKLRYSLLYWPFVRGIVQILEFGAKKYSLGSWKTVPDAEIRYRDAAIRHIMDATHDLDPESGLDPLLHAACNLMFLYFFKCEKRKTIPDSIDEVPR